MLCRISTTEPEIFLPPKNFGVEVAAEAELTNVNIAHFWPLPDDIKEKSCVVFRVDSAGKGREVGDGGTLANMAEYLGGLEA